MQSLPANREARRRRWPASAGQSDWRQALALELPLFGKAKTLALGAYPEVSLAMARECILGHRAKQNVVGIAMQSALLAISGLFSPKGLT